MPMVSRTTKSCIESESNLLKALETQIASWSQKPTSMYIFELHQVFDGKEEFPEIAVATFGPHSCALYAQENLTEKELVIFEFFLRDLDPDDQIVVFNQRDFDAVKKYLYGKKVDVGIDF